MKNMIPDNKKSERTHPRGLNDLGFEFSICFMTSNESVEKAIYKQSYFKLYMLFLVFVFLGKRVKM